MTVFFRKTVILRWAGIVTMRLSMDLLNNPLQYYHCQWGAQEHSAFVQSIVGPTKRISCYVTVTWFRWMDCFKTCSSTGTHTRFFLYSQLFTIWTCQVFPQCESLAGQESTSRSGGSWTMTFLKLVVDDSTWCPVELHTYHIRMRMPWKWVVRQVRLTQFVFLHLESKRSHKTTILSLSVMTVFRRESSFEYASHVQGHISAI